MTQIQTNTPCCLWDCHTHTCFSGDSDADISDMIEAAISNGLSGICFTDHLDLDYPYEEPGMFELPMDYYEQIKSLADAYQNRIDICYGVETGLAPGLNDRLDAFLDRHPYDFVIGSSHLVHGKDPYFPDYFEGRSDKEAFLEYFSSILENVKDCRNFDVYGHIDYVVRYSPNKAANYSYKQYQEILDEILMTLINLSKGIEINTSGFRSGLDFPNPHPDIIRRYKELGGEIITIGSDAHKPQDVAKDFHLAKDILLSCGFTYYSVFKDRKPTFIQL